MSGATLLAICGSVGGAGKTTLAANLAVSLATQQAGRVLLVDAALGGPGDAALFAGMDSPRTLAHFASIAGRLGPELLASYLSPAANAVTAVALTTESLRDTADLESKLPTLMTMAASLYDYVVFDFPTGATVELRHLGGLCHSAIVATTLSPTALLRTRSFADGLRARHFRGSAISCCLNRITGSDTISREQLEADLGVSCAAILPEDRGAVAAALGRGQTLVQSAPRHAITRAVDSLARRIAGGRQSAPPVVAAVASNEVGNRSVKLRIHRRLVDEMSLQKTDLSSLSDPVKQQELRSRVEAALVSLIDEEAAALTMVERRRFLKELLDDTLGLGPIEDLLADPSITEIMVNGPDRVYVERNGTIAATDVCFTSTEQLLGVIERVVAPLGRRIDEKVPMVDARLRDGSRVNAVIPPLTRAPVMTIRKFSRRTLTVPDLIELGTLSSQMAWFLEAAVKARLNILISGGTGSGKTTLLNVLSSFIPPNERIVTIEDAAELRLAQDHVVGMESRQSNIEGSGAITIRDLVRNALRMRPDRIVVGECRGGEALDMLQAMNTGHDGSLTTVHANSARDALGRLETLSLMAGLTLPARAIRDQIASAVNVVVQQARLKDGSRRVTGISELVGLVDGEFQIQDLFVLKVTGVDRDGRIRGTFSPTGHIPSSHDALERDGVHLPKELFVLQSTTT